MALSGSQDGARLSRIPAQALQAAQVRIAVSACAPVQSAGQRASGVLGGTLCGRVTEADPDAVGVFVGDRVMAAAPGGAMATEACIPSASCWIAPGALSDLDAAAVPDAYGPAMLALCHRGPVAEGETVLLVLDGPLNRLAALAAVARWRGAAVGVIAPNDAAAERAEAFGADHVSVGAPSAVRADGGQALGRVDILVTDRAAAALVELIQPEGRVVLLDEGAGEAMATGPFAARNLTVEFCDWAKTVAQVPDTVRRLMTALSGALNDGRLPRLPVTPSTLGALAETAAWASDGETIVAKVTGDDSEDIG